MWKYVMVGFDSEYFKYCFSDKSTDDTFLFLDNTMGDGILSKIQKLCVSERVNKYVNIPLKQIWMNDYARWLKYCEYDICFVFSKTQSWLLQYNNGQYITLLRSLYPGCRIILYLGDLISSYVKFDVSFFKNKCDHVISYDSEDSKKYNLLYTPLPYGKLIIKDDDKIPEIDVFFCGKAKNRLNEIYSIYDYVTGMGLKALFFVTGVNKSVQRSNGIIYNHQIEYARYLQYLMKSEAVVEIKQKESSGDTLRVKEAFTYGKMLITNNVEVKKRHFYNPNQVYIYDEKHGINIDRFNVNRNRAFREIKFDEMFRFLNYICNKEK